MKQLSVEPSFKSDPTIEVIPLLPKYTVIFFVTTMGFNVSETVTTALATPILPLLSSTNN